MSLFILNNNYVNIVIQQLPILINKGFNSYYYSHYLLLLLREGLVLHICNIRSSTDFKFPNMDTCFLLLLLYLLNRMKLYLQLQ